MAPRLRTADLIERVAALGPRVRPIVEEHLATYDGEVLLHVLMADLRRWAVATFYNLYDDAAVRSLLLVLEEALRAGDDAVVNAVAVSFVLDACPEDPRLAPFVETWPAGLRAEVRRRREAGSG